MPLSLDPASLTDSLAFSLPADPSLVSPEHSAGVDRWQALIEQQLERQLSGQAPAAWDDLVAACATLEALHEQSREQIERLLPYTGEPATGLAAAYVATHMAGALADAALQARLGTLGERELAAINGCLQPIAQGQEPPQAYRLERVELSEGDQHGTWAGALVLTTLAPLADVSEPPRVLLYQFGLHGGWSAYQGYQPLLDALSTALASAPPQTIRLAPAAWTAFEDVLGEHLAMLQALRATAPADDPGGHERALIEALELLTVPLEPPRLLALARVKETRRSLRLGEEAGPWLSRLSPAAGTQLAGLITEYAAAMSTSERLLRRDLPSRRAYAARRIREHLTVAFALTAPCRIRLSIPARVDSVRELISGSGAPGTPTRLVPRPSLDTETITLEQLALEQIDEVMAQRLQFLEVQVVPAHHPQAAALKAQIDVTWLSEAVRELDVAGDYERLLADVYLRAGPLRDSADEALALHRPYALMLDLQAAVAMHQGRLDGRGRHMVRVARDAASPQAWAVGGLDLTLRPAAMTLFDENTQSAGSTLAGVVFIHDRASDTTVLCLPEAPNGRGLGQYPSLESAEQALEDLFLDATLRGYLCRRALEGDPQVLESLVDQALARGFRNLIQARAPWPAHQSLTKNQFLADLGLRITAHRWSSVSNTDRVFEQALQSREKAVRYIRMAVGFVPFVGSLIALVDALESGIEAGRAFAEGDGPGGVEATQSVLLSLADALFDFGPGALAAAPGPASLRATAKARQLRQGAQGVARLRQLSGWNARRADEAFSGYEHTVTPRSRPGTEGQWLGIHQEPEGNFIVRGSSTYAVEWDASLHTWRLAATRARSYRQPITLDETGHWQTHGHVYGSLVEGGLRGGGGVQSYLADRLDPYWPDRLRRLLPRWWADGLFRRQQQLITERNSRMAAVAARDHQVDRTLTAYRASQGPAQAVIDAGEQSIQAAIDLHHTLDRFRTLTRGRRFTEAGVDQSRAAATICARSHLQVKVAFVETEQLAQVALAQRAELSRVIRELYRGAGPDSLVPQALVDQANDIRDTLARLLSRYDQIDQSLQRLRLWQRRVTVAEHRRVLHGDTQTLSSAFTDEKVSMLRIALLMDLAPQDDLTRTSWGYMRRLYAPARERYDRVAQSALNAESLSLRPQQRQRLTTQVQEQNRALSRLVRRLSVSYPDQFDPVYTERLLQELEKAREAIPAPTVPPERVPGRVRPQAFEGDGLLLVGEPVSGEPGVLVLGQVNNQPERWAQRADRSWAPVVQTPPTAPARSLQNVVRHGRERLAELPAFRARVSRYTHPRTPAADLEDLYLGQSQELEFTARQLQSLDPEQRHVALIEHLEEQAQTLRAEGRQARIDHIKASPTPTAGHLDYLFDAHEVRIRKLGNLQVSGTGARTRNWLQEYEILDARTGRPWCYAHFHYEQPQPRFAGFVAAHLKTPTQRFQLAAAPGEPAIWRGEISRQLASKLFEPLWN